MTGAPKEATCRAIAEAEGYGEGVLYRIFGFFNGRDLDSAVSIRFMEEDERGMVYKSGGGITVMSRMEEEYREAVAKVYVPFDFLKPLNGRMALPACFPGTSGGWKPPSAFMVRTELPFPIWLPFFRPVLARRAVEFTNAISRMIRGEGCAAPRFEPYRPRQVQTLTCVEMPGLDYSCKWEDRTGLLAAGAALGCDEEALILRNRMVTDTRYSNVVFGDGSSWITPETFLLPGTKRAFLLSRGDIQECSVRAEDIGKFASVP